LDGGRRERLVVGLPAVISVEGRTARLRRAPLEGVLRARDVGIEVQVLGLPAPPQAPARLSAFRPRPRSLPGPSAGLDARARIVTLVGSTAEHRPAQILALEPADAADRILDQLRTWGYLG
jgi:electron transfer flavoprotein alpha/beta subunit